MRAPRKGVCCHIYNCRNSLPEKVHFSHSLMTVYRGLFRETYGCGLAVCFGVAFFVWGISFHDSMMSQKLLSVRHTKMSLSRMHTGIPGNMQGCEGFPTSSFQIQLASNFMLQVGCPLVSPLSTVISFLSFFVRVCAISVA